MLNSALQLATEDEHLDAIERLLQANVDVNAAAADSDDRTALQAAARDEHLDVIETLRAAKAE